MYFQLSPISNESIMNLWNYENSVEQYNVVGGTSRQAVLEQIKHLKNQI